MSHEIHTQVSADELAKTFDEAPAEVSFSHIGFEDWITLGLFWGMAGCVFLQFFTRYVLNDSYAWTEELATYCLVVIVFFASSMCVRLSRHIQVDFLYRYIPASAARALSTVIDLIRVAFFAYAIRLVYIFIKIVADEEMTTVHLPKGLFYWMVFIAFILMLIRSIQVAWENWRRGYSILERPGAFDGSEAA